MKHKEEHEFANIEQLGGYLKEAKATEDEYESQFDLEYVFDAEFKYGALQELNRLGIEHSFHDTNFSERITVQLKGAGVEGIEKIMRFDAWFTLTKMLDVAAMMRIEQIDLELANPMKYRLLQKLGRISRIPENIEIETEVKSMYLAQGLVL